MDDKNTKNFSLHSWLGKVVGKAVTDTTSGAIAWLFTAALLGIAAYFGFSKDAGKQPPPPAAATTPTPSAVGSGTNGPAPSNESRKAGATPARSPDSEELPAAPPRLPEKSAEPETMEAAPARIAPPAEKSQPIELDIGTNALGLSATISEPVVVSNKWTMMTFTLFLRASSAGRIALPQDVYYKLPGWSAQVGNSRTPCESNGDRVRWPAGRGQDIEIEANEEIAIPIEFSCGIGDDYQPGDHASVGLQLMVSDGARFKAVRLRASAIAYTPPANKRW